MTIVVRFNELERYDINRDADTLTLMATTNNGSYWTEFAVAGKSHREMRKRFKERVIEAIQRGESPREVDVEAE